MDQTTWVALCSHQSCERWRTVDVRELEEVAQNCGASSIYASSVMYCTASDVLGYLRMRVQQVRLMVYAIGTHSLRQGSRVLRP